MIRHATIADREAMIDMGEKFHRESRQAFIPFSRARVGVTLDHCFANGFCMVHEGPSGIDAAMSGVIGPTTFSEALVATELALYVTPGRRGGVLASRLIDAFCVWAKARGAVEVIAGSTAGIATEQTQRLYEHHDFQLVGPLLARRL